MHGYQLIQQIGERSGGTWRPSPGAIYPALNLLEDEGLVAITAESGRKMATLTEAGGTYVTENAEQLGSPWEDAANRPASPGRALRGALEALGAAAHQVARTGTDEQATKALEVLDRARRDLYLILAGEAVAGRPGRTDLPIPTRHPRERGASSRHDDRRGVPASGAPRPPTRTRRRSRRQRAERRDGREHRDERDGERRADEPDPGHRRPAERRSTAVPTR